jgi:hypothetical protein
MGQVYFDSLWFLFISNAYFVWFDMIRKYMECLIYCFMFLKSNSQSTHVWSILYFFMSHEYIIKY